MPDHRIGSAEGDVHATSRRDVLLGAAGVVGTAALALPFAASAADKPVVPAGLDQKGQRWA